MKNLNVFIAILFLFSCQKADFQKSDKALINEYQALVQTPAISVAMLKSGSKKPLLYAAGKTRPNQETPPLVPIRIGSITKVFLAPHIPSLIKESVLKKRNNCRYFFPQTPFLKGITIAQLLSHTSGLPDIFDGIQNPESVKTMATDDVWSTIKNKRFTPSGNAHYSNLNYIILGKIIKLAKKLLEKYSSTKH